MLCDGIHPHFNISPVDELVDLGDLCLPNTSLAEMRKTLEPMAKELVDNHHVVFLGGDHSITLSLLRAQFAKVGEATMLRPTLHNHTACRPSHGCGSL
jgi:agmatinase